MSWMAMNDHERFWKTVLFHSWKKKENYERNFLKCERKLKNLKEIFFHREWKPFIVERKMKEERNFVFVKELRKVMKCKKDFEKKEERKRMICEWLFFFHERRKRSMKGGERRRMAMNGFHSSKFLNVNDVSCKLSLKIEFGKIYYY